MKVLACALIGVATVIADVTLAELVGGGETFLILLIALEMIAAGAIILFRQYRTMR